MDKNSYRILQVDLFPKYFLERNKYFMMTNVESSITYSYTSQEHCTDGVTGFPVSKLIVIPLITFFGYFATFFGNNFLLLQRFLIKKLLLDEVILPSR